MDRRSMSTAPLPQSSASRAACPECGTAFACEPEGACWCKDEAYRVPMPDPAAAAGCLCPACLRKLAAKQPATARP